VLKSKVRGQFSRHISGAAVIHPEAEEYGSPESFLEKEEDCTAGVGTSIVSAEGERECRDAGHKTTRISGCLVSFDGSAR
jgi:hypothetical protein